MKLKNWLLKVSSLFITCLFFSIALSAASDAYASPMIPKSVEAMLKKMGIQERQSEKKIRKCENFSGKWKGHCIFDSGFTERWDFNIQQEGCEYLSGFGAHEMGQSTTINSHERDTTEGAFSTWYASWIRSGEVLEFRTLELGSFDFEDNLPSDWFHSIVGTMEIKRGMLNVTVKPRSFTAPGDDFQFGEEAQHGFHCALSRI